MKLRISDPEGLCGDLDLLDERGVVRAQVFNRGPGKPWELARLLEAAPALLATCEKLLDIIQAKGGAFALLHQAECAEAAAAIAKARPDGKDGGR